MAALNGSTGGADAPAESPLVSTLARLSGAQLGRLYAAPASCLSIFRCVLWPS